MDFFFFLVSPFIPLAADTGLFSVFVHTNANENQEIHGENCPASDGGSWLYVCNGIDLISAINTQNL